MKKIISLLTILSVVFVFSACKSAKKQNDENILKSTVTNAEGKQLELAYDTDNELVTIIFEGDTSVLKQQPSASGINYKNETYELTEWQNEVELLKNGTLVFSNVEIDNRPIPPVTLKDEAGELLTLQYDTSGEKPIVTITYKDIKDEVLTQTYAWAKGGEYENENLRWTDSHEGGILVIDGKEIKFVKNLEQ